VASSVRPERHVSPILRKTGARPRRRRRVLRVRRHDSSMAMARCRSYNWFRAGPRGYSASTTQVATVRGRSAGSNRKITVPLTRQCGAQVPAVGGSRRRSSSSTFKSARSPPSYTTVTSRRARPQARRLQCRSNHDRRLFLENQLLLLHRAAPCAPAKKREMACVLRRSRPLREGLHQDDHAHHPAVLPFVPAATIRVPVAEQRRVARALTSSETTMQAAGTAAQT